MSDVSNTSNEEEYDGDGRVPPGVIRRRRFILGAASVGMTGALAGCSGGQDTPTDEDGGDGDGDGNGDGDGSGDGGDGDGDGGNGQGLGEPVEEIEVVSTTSGYDPQREQMASYLVDNIFPELGIPATLTTRDLSEFIDIVFSNREFGVAAIRWAPTQARLDPDTFTRGSFGSPDNTYNVGGWQNDEFQEVAQNQAGELDRNARQGMVDELQQILRDQQPTLNVMNHELWQMYRTDTLTNWTPGLGFGISHFFNDLNVQGAGGNDAIRSGHTSVIKTFNPVSAIQNQSFRDIRRVYDKLFRVNLDGEIVPWVAESYEAPDNTTIVCQIRPGQRWHDGEPLTAEDVKFSYDYQKEHEHPFLAPQFERVESFEITGNSEVTINLTEPYAPIYYNLLAKNYIIPQHIWQDIDNPLEVSNDEPVGSGPWKFVSWEQDSQAEYEANQNHFSPPNVSRYLRVKYSNKPALAQAVFSGDIDRTGYTIPVRLADEYEGRSDAVTVESVRQHGRYELRYNIAEHDVFQDVEVRKAIAHATNLDEMRQIIYGGVGNLIADPIKYPEFWNQETDLYEFNVEQARQLLSDAGYGWDDNGRLHYPAN